VLNRGVDIALAGLLAAFSLPLLTFTLLITRLQSGAAAIAPRPGADRGTRGRGALQPPFADEFGFERAIEAYEELIDATHTEGRT
jgi:hypothetical protein